MVFATGRGLRVHCALSELTFRYSWQTIILVPGAEFTPLLLPHAATIGWFVTGLMDDLLCIVFTPLAEGHGWFDLRALALGPAAFVINQRVHLPRTA